MSCRLWYTRSDKGISELTTPCSYAAHKTGQWWVNHPPRSFWWMQVRAEAFCRLQLYIHHGHENHGNFGHLKIDLNCSFSLPLTNKNWVQKLEVFLDFLWSTQHQKTASLSRLRKRFSRKHLASPCGQLQISVKLEGADSLWTAMLAFQPWGCLRRSSYFM